MKTGRKVTHGFAKRGIKRPKEYNSWMQMIGRCTNPNHVRFGVYGAVGISVCKRWRTFSLFLSDMGKAPSKNHTLDRYPNKSGNYEPGNVRWATPKEQSRNTKRNIMVEIGGKIKCLSEWAEEMGLNYHTVISRIHSGLNPISALLTPKIIRGNSVVKMLPSGLILEYYSSITDAASANNIGRSAISNVLCGYNKTAAGFKWKYT